MTDPVVEQYNAWPYPSVAWGIGKRTLWNDPAVYQARLWPVLGAPDPLRILIAGCGTTEAAAMAACHPGAEVVGIDVSATSLALQQAHAEEHGVTNLELLELPIEQVGSLGRQFEFVGCGGVLHHLVAPVVGMRALGEVLAPEGVLVAAVYGAHARRGLRSLQQAIRALKIPRSDEGLAAIRALLPRLPDSHSAWPWFVRVKEDGSNGAHLIDVCLPAREHLMTVDDVVDGVEHAGLAFQGWLKNRPYHPESRFDPGTPNHDLFAHLEGRALWATVAALTEPLDHLFIACRADRPPAHYAADLRDPLTRVLRRFGPPVSWFTPDQEALLRRSERPVTLGEVLPEGVDPVAVVEPLLRTDRVWVLPPV